MTPVTIIVVNYNSGTRLHKCVEAVLEQTFSDFLLYIIDNNSSDNSLNNLPSDARVIVRELPDNEGFAAANNIGFRRAESEWVITLNPDAYPAKDWLEQLLAATERYPGVTMFGSMQYADADHTVMDGAGDEYYFAGIPWRSYYQQPAKITPHEDREVFAPCAAAAMYQREAVLEVGGFDEMFFCYCEDVDLAFRLRLLGHRVVQVAAAKVEHEGSAVTGAKSDFTIYHSFRNRLWLYVKNMPSWLLWVCGPFHDLALILLLLKAWMQGQGKPAFDGVKDGFASIDVQWKARREIQANRTVSPWKIARALCWNPLRMLGRR